MNLIAIKKNSIRVFTDSAVKNIRLTGIALMAEYDRKVSKTTRVFFLYVSFASLICWAEMHTPYQAIMTFWCLLAGLMGTYNLIQEVVEKSTEKSFVSKVCLSAAAVLFAIIPIYIFGYMFISIYRP